LLKRLSPLAEEGRDSIVLDALIGF